MVKSRLSLLGIPVRRLALVCAALLCLTGCAARTPADSSSDASAESDVNPYAFQEIGRCATGNSLQYLFDSDAILFIEGERTLCRADTDGTKKTVLFTAPRATMGYYFTLGGKCLFFWNDYNGSDAQFYSVPLEGGDAREIHWDGYCAGDIFFYADGRLYFVATRQGDADGSPWDILCSSLPDGSDIREIYGQNDRLSIRLERLDPDGFIVFTFAAFQTADDYQLAQIRPDGSGFSQRDPAADAYRVAFTEKDRMLYTALFTPFTGSQTEKVCISKYETTSVLDRPADGWVYAVQKRGEEPDLTKVFVKMREDGRDPQVLFAIDDTDREREYLLAVQNGKIYFTAAPVNRYDIAQLWIVNLDGSDMKMICEYATR